MTATAELVKQFNVVARTTFNKKYESHKPKFKELLFAFDSGLVDSNFFPYFDFLDQVEEWTGTRIYQAFPEGHQFRIENKKFDTGIKIGVEKFERAANQVNNALAPLNPYKIRIGELGVMAADFPSVRALDMVIDGDTNTFGTTFDGQNFFSATHDYAPTAGSQNNIITGTGTSLSQIEADLISARSRFAGFSYVQSPNDRPRGLNESIEGMKMLVIAPSDLDGQFYKLKQSTFFNNSDNPSRTTFDFMTLPSLTADDPNDWYVALLDEEMMKPFLHQIEKPFAIDLPKADDESVRQRDEFEWGIRGRMNIAYGAWWKMIKITNT